MKKEIASDYFETEEGKFIKHQSKKIRIEGILCFALGLIYLLFDVIKKKLGKCIYLLLAYLLLELILFINHIALKILKRKYTIIKRIINKKFAIVINKCYNLICLR